MEHEATSARGYLIDGAPVALCDECAHVERVDGQHASMSDALGESSASCVGVTHDGHVYCHGAGLYLSTRSGVAAYRVAETSVPFCVPCSVAFAIHHHHYRKPEQVEGEAGGVCAGVVIEGTRLCVTADRLNEGGRRRHERPEQLGESSGSWEKAWRRNLRSQPQRRRVAA